MSTKKAGAVILRPFHYQDLSGSTTEVIKHDVFAVNAEIKQHVDHRLVHDRRTAHIIFAVFRSFMVTQILFIQHIVNEAGVTIPIVFRQSIRQGHIPSEVRMLFGQLVEIFHIEHFALGAGTIPEGNLCVWYRGA